MTKTRKRISLISALMVVLFAFTLLCGMHTPVSAAALTGKTANQVVADLGIGWNLGNTLDATGGGGTLNSETSWGNPKTTKAMIDAVKAQGFNTVRIPVSWGSHMTRRAEGYVIDSAWMARVKEVVDYAIDNNMYVILNIHHDNDKKYGDDDRFFYPNSTYKDQSIAFVKAIWTQVSETFKSYDQHLIFETLNEPRLVGTGDEWWFPVNSPNANVTDAINVINEMNQQAVNVIRASGGNNAERCIMIPGYGASIDGCTTAGYKLPTDTASNKLIVSVHAYTPYNFALNASGTSVFNASGKNEVDYLFNTLKSKFISKSIPVVIGETSASNKNNTAERVKWAEYYMGKSAEIGIPCMIWDNNVKYSTSNLGENHGHLNRLTLTWNDQEFVDALVEPFFKLKDVTGFEVGGRTAAAIRLNWDVNSTADGYIVEQYKSGKWTRIARIAGNSTNTLRVSGLTAGETYKFRIKAYKIDGSNALYSGYTQLSAGTNPSAMTGFRLAGKSGTALRLAWDKNTSADGYIIEQLKDGKWTRIARITGNETTSYRVSGLQGFTAYKFRMRAYSISSGTALYSAYTSVSAWRTNPTAVSGLKFVDRTTTALRLGWNQNDSAAGYIVEQYKDGAWTRIARISGKETLDYRIGGLESGTTYKFRVQTFNFMGTTPSYSAFTEISGTTK